LTGQSVAGWRDAVFDCLAHADTDARTFLMKVAIIHYWLVGMRGGEKVIEALCEMYPQADIFTHVYVPDAVSDRIRQHRVVPTFINSLPRAARMYKTYLPLMPLALEQLDLRGYDLVISSESGPSKGIIPPSDAVHVCYCHTPMRYIWNMYHDYRDSAGLLTRWMMPPLAHYLRMWDVSSAARVDSFVANSTTVAKRIRRFYGADRLATGHPLFDIVLMGVGADGHTASLFPGRAELEEKERWVVGVHEAGLEPFVPRVTLTFPTLASTREMLFLVDGVTKRSVLSCLLAGADLPAARVYSEGDLVWLVDREAAPEHHDGA